MTTENNHAMESNGDKILQTIKQHTPAIAPIETIRNEAKASIRAYLRETGSEGNVARAVNELVQPDPDEKLLMSYGHLAEAIMSLMFVPEHSVALLRRLPLTSHEKLFTMLNGLKEFFRTLTEDETAAELELYQLLYCPTHRDPEELVDTKEYYEKKAGVAKAERGVWD